jgi:hypothetical protein
VNGKPFTRFTEARKLKSDVAVSATLLRSASGRNRSARWRPLESSSGLRGPKMHRASGRPTLRRLGSFVVRATRKPRLPHGPPLSAPRTTVRQYLTVARCTSRWMTETLLASPNWTTSRQSRLCPEEVRRARNRCTTARCRRARCACAGTQSCMAGLYAQRCLLLQGSRVSETQAAVA